MRRLKATSGAGLVVPLIAALGCVAPVARDRSIAELEGTNPEAAAERMEALGDAAVTRTLRTRRYLEAARLYLAAGDPVRALAAARKARAAYPSGHVPASVYRLLGRAYLEAGEAGLAARYLAKGLSGARGAERDTTLASLARASRLQGDEASARRYEEEISHPDDPEVRDILESPSPTRKRAAGRAATPRAPSREERRPGRIARRAQPQGLLRRRPPRPPSSGAEESRLVVIPRSVWRAQPVRSNVEPMGRVDKITVHHSAGEPFWGHGISEAAQEIRRIQRFHQNQRGWADIGYHYIIDRDGHVWQGRPLAFQGAHARGKANRGNIGIVVLGDYTRQSLNAAQERALLLLLAKLTRYFQIPPWRIYTHREILHGHTDCPGPEISRFIAAARETLRRLAYKR